MSVKFFVILGQRRPTAGNALRAGFWDQDTVETGIFWGVLNVSKTCLFYFYHETPTDPLEEVMIVGVSQGAQTDPFEEVIIFAELNG